MSDWTLSDPWFCITNGKAMAKALLQEAEGGRDDNFSRRAFACVYASAFEGLSVSAYNMSGASLAMTPGWGIMNVPIVRNELRAVIQTLVAKVAAPDQPQPFVACNGGDWEQRTKAEDVRDFLLAEMKLPQGQWDTLDDMWNQAMLMATAATGTSAIIIGPGYDQVDCELDDTLNMRVYQSSKRGAVEGYVRTLWRDPHSMMAKYTKKKDRDAIRAAIVEVDDVLQLDSSNPNRPLRKRRMVELVEGVRCTVYDVVGRRVLITNKGHVLEDKDYDYPDPPVVFLTWDRPISGFWGTPASQAVLAEFLMMNRLYSDVDNTVLNSPDLVVAAPEDVQDQLAKAHGIQRIATDSPDRIKIFPTDKLNNANLIMAKDHGEGIHTTLGVSPSQSAGQRVVGTRSGFHEEMVAKLTSERFADNQQRIVQAKVVRSSKLFLRAASEMIESKECKAFTRRFLAADGKTYREVKATDLDIADDRYVITIAPVSAAYRSPQDLAAKADELLKLGQLDGATWWQTQQNANVSAAQAVVDAQTEWTNAQIRNFLTAPLEKLSELYLPPRKLQDPVSMGRLVTAQLQLAQIHNCPPERIEWFDRFLDDIIALLQEEPAPPDEATALAAETAQGALLGAG